MQLILKAEGEYRDSVKSAATEAEDYADARKKEQSAYFDVLKQEYQLFEKAENEKMKNAFSEQQRQIEEETVNAKLLLKERCDKKAEAISERLKKEVLSLSGYS